MGVEHESAFEAEICEHLFAHGWHFTPEHERTGYDKKRALFVPDVLAWLQETQPEQWAKVVKPSTSQAEQAKAVEGLLDRLVKTLDLPLDQGGGTLNVLRAGFKKTPASFQMAEFKPATSLNATALARYEAVRVRVMPQVYYSTKHTNSIDLVLFVNGLPVATLELKTENTQSIAHAIKQYRTDRLPAGEPLLGFGRCLVHFAVSNDEVHMTTRLAGPDTHFLPFNTGRDGGAGNPPVEGRAATAYLWERVLQRDAWLHILGRLMHLEHRTETDPISGAIAKKSTLLFPRFHQWDLVTSLTSAVKAEGPGHHYLIQHSAGSGKTNSIAWTAHGLASLHTDDNEKVFDSVIVVTDRTVLDDQLQAAVKQIEGTTGTVATINVDEAFKAGETSKSGLLATELLAGRLIVIVTMQTFPHALKAIQENKGLAGKNFAIIADEAHSSQTGKTSQKLKAVLTSEELKDLEDGGEFDAEALLAAEMAQRASSENLSFFAFTATPKPKTMELFGRLPKGSAGDDGPRPFHVYTMQQAIEEGYILDVLLNYTSYDTAFQIAEQAKGEAKLKSVELVDESEATQHLMKWVSLHPSNIAQKVQIIVEHYRTNVRHLLDGHAKAMVVTGSREHAIRYKEAIDAYIKKSGYTDVATLVAFSGSMTAEQVPGASFAGVEAPYTEHNLNAGLRGRTIPKAFGTDDFQILIVANKYQTGFDQPLLCAMYVDKKLDGVSAVQTLSRLNRTYAKGGKDTTYVLDFVNDPIDVLNAFLPYYKDARIDGTTDPDIVHDIRAKLDAAAIYTDAEIDAFTHAYVAGKHGAVTAPLTSAAQRFADAWHAAQDAGDKGRVEELELFRKDVGSFVRLYDFLSQIINYEDVDLEKRSLFLRLLKPRLVRAEGSEIIDLSTVELTHIKQARAADQTLDLKGGEVVPLQPATAAGSGQSRDPHMMLLEEVLAKVNALFDGEDFTPGQQRSWVEGLVTVLGENSTIRTQAGANSSQQFVESPHLSDAVTDAVLSSSEAYAKMIEKFFGDEQFKHQMVRFLGTLVHDEVNRAGHVS